MKINLETGLKKCSKCHVDKSSDNFARDASTSDGYFHMCKVCTSAKSKAYYYNHQETRLEQITAYNEAHKDDPIWDAYNANAKDQKLRKLYNITLDEFNYMWEQQQGYCGACHVELKRQTGGHAVDHNHISGKVRGLLCMKCNVILGFAEDNGDLLQSLSEYVKTNIISSV